MQYFLIFLIFGVMHCFVWVSTNWQLVEGTNKSHALIASLILAIPISMLAFYGTKVAYATFESAWSIRLLVFGISYLTFPIMTWVFLHETPFTLKTSICIALSVLIILVQLFVPNS